MNSAAPIASVHTPATRWSLAILSCGTTALLLTMYLRTIASNGYHVLELASAVVFAILAIWIGFSFWSATLGLLRAMIIEEPGEETDSPPFSAATGERPAAGRTAILIPVYNESPEAVFARLEAMLESLGATGQADQFDFFVLSDTTNPEVWLQEEWAWSDLNARGPWPANVFYRRRTKNLQRKAGNIADFCCRWGQNYEFMIVLDADSLMTGETFVEMVRRMQRDSKLGILQVPPRPVNRNSLFARLQQFAAAAYSPICIYGFDAWSCQQGNYWGHNAIIRVAPFMQHCELPILPGKKPLGGEILSHDFVEAALMAAHGWKVRLACDLEGSYEECPTTLVDYLQRDQRWCQGNLQHARLIISEGFHPLSRMHFAMGVMSYVASPIWLLFMVLSLTGYWWERTTVAAPEPASATIPLVLFVSVMSLLLLPKLWSVIALTRSPELVRGLGGWSGVIGSVFVETLASMLIAPIVGFYHSVFVLLNLLGKTVGWGAQRRDETVVTFRDAVVAHASVFAAYVVTGTLVAWQLPELLAWMSPLLAGPLLVFPIAMLAGSARVGLFLRRRNLLVIPEEQNAPRILRAVAEVNARQEQFERDADRPYWQRLLTEPAFRNVHYNILEQTASACTASDADILLAENSLAEQAFNELPREVRCTILADRSAIERLANHYSRTTSG